MAVTTYRTYNGRLRAEITDGVRKTYLTDALGSVTATVDSSQNVMNTYRHKPSGRVFVRATVSPGSATPPVDFSSSMASAQVVHTRRKFA
jgi:hypothetical protein